MKIIKNLHKRRKQNCTKKGGIKSGRGMTMLRVTPFLFFIMKTRIYLAKEAQGVTRNMVLPARPGGARD